VTHPVSKDVSFSSTVVGLTRRLNCRSSLSSVYANVCCTALCSFAYLADLAGSGNQNKGLPAIRRIQHRARACPNRCGHGGSVLSAVSRACDVWRRIQCQEDTSRAISTQWLGP